MDMEILDIVIAGVIICLVGMAQSAVGFGYALFATPLLMLIGIPLPNVIALVATCSMSQAIIGARKLHASVPWRLSLTATVVRLAKCCRWFIPTQEAGCREYAPCRDARIVQ